MSEITKKADQLKNTLAKKGINTSLSEPDEYISTGNLNLDYAITGHFLRGAIPNKRLTMLSGPSGTGKSFLLGNIAKNAQEKGRFIVYIDTENAIDVDFLTKIGVQTDEEHFLPIRVSTLEELTEIVSNLFKNFGNDEKLCVIVDSLTMAMLQEEAKTFDEKGELTEDRGREAKKRKQFLQNVNSKVGDKDIVFLCSTHAYVNQNPQNGQGNYIISGGEGQLYIPSITLMLNKLKLKEEQEIKGIRLKYEILKNRIRPSAGFKNEVQVRFDEGMKEYYGLLNLFEEMGLIKKNGPWKSYVNSKGEEIKFQNKDFEQHYMEIIHGYNPQQHEILNYNAPVDEEDEEVASSNG